MICFAHFLAKLSGLRDKNVRGLNNSVLIYLVGKFLNSYVSPVASSILLAGKTTILRCLVLSAELV